MSDPLHDHMVRVAAFKWLEEQVVAVGDYVLPWALLRAGFSFEGTRVPLVSPKGIFRPAVLPEIPLTIRSSESGPYDDGLSPDGHLLYRYRGKDPWHRDNVGLREAMIQSKPLIYLRAAGGGRYLTAWPIYVVDDDPAGLTFTVSLERSRALGRGDDEGLIQDPPDIQQAYGSATVRRRLHQSIFRERVLSAYRRQCALCRLRYPELLDAAHIIPDPELEGEPIVQNGLSLCKLHHAAFDHNFLGVRPDYVVEVREDVLEEEDGPMLVHGLQDLHSQRILLPRLSRLRPDPERLASRYERFRAAG